jgi:hypothetical protein
LFANVLAGLMKIVIESPGRRATYSTVAAAGLALAAWLRRETDHEHRATCSAISVSVHAEGENCDHEVEAAHA